MECANGDDQSGGLKLNNNSWNSIIIKKKKLKSGWEYPNESSCSWATRQYKCGFCKRAFKSAQALGGHMNVHRRERAKLVSNPNPSTTPYNPNVLTLSSSTLPPGVYANQFSLVSLSLSFHDVSASNFKAILSVNDEEKNDRGVNLDLDLKLIRDTKEDDLDLELRLGASLKP